MEQPSFEKLVKQIYHTNEALQQNASLAINRSLTTRNWLIGHYIVEYEQNGSDKAKYGERLLQQLSERLADGNFSLSYLKIYRQFYLNFHVLRLPVSEFIKGYLQIGQSVIVQSLLPEFEDMIKGQSVIDLFHSEKDSALVSKEISVSPQLLFDRLSFTHLIQLLPIKDPLQRTFYEIETIKGTWSVRELKRQINSNYYIRSGWSENPEKLAALINEKASLASIKEDIKSPFTFEFLGMKAKDIIEESTLEQAIMDHLQEFMLELGLGFCFEARQKKLLIDDKYYFADLIFYHRILKCHCIVEVKSRRLDYPDIAQLNMYMGYYRKYMMCDNDNPPIGILLCTEAGAEMVEFATAGIDPQLFVSKYELQLPSPEKMTNFLKKENAALK